MLPFDPDWDEQDPSKNHNELLGGEVVLWRNAQWRVTNFFLEEKADPGVLGPPYYIEREAIEFDLHLVQHVCSKSWVNHDLFLEAYDKARELYGFGPAWHSQFQTTDQLAAKLGLAR